MMVSSADHLVIRVLPDSLDDPKFSLGVVRLARDQRVRFLNRAASRMVDDEVQVGDALTDVIELDPEARQTLLEALRERFEQERATAYTLSVGHLDSGTRVKVHISAIPEYDEQGDLIGSIGFIVDESIDTATMGIHRAIQQAASPDDIYAALAREMRQVVAFDSLSIFSVNAKGTHLQRLYEDPAPPKDVMPTKWWPMRPFVKAMVEHFVPGPLNLKALFAQPDFVGYAQEDAAMRQFLERGFHSALQVGVFHQKRLVAMVSLLRCSEQAFTPEEYGRCLRLPAVEAVNAGMTLAKQRDLQFGLDLINEIAEVAESISQVAQRLVDCLAAHYGWEHVSLFRVDEDRKRLRMICQASSRDCRLPEDHEQSFAQGLIGLAYTEKRAVNAGDVSSREWADIYIQGISDTLSELVLPVPGSKLRWLLNIEAKQRDAFADEEQSSVALLLRVAGFILDRTATLELKAAILKSVADAVIQTDAMGVIQSINPAARELLGRPLDQLQHRSVASLIVPEGDPELAGMEDPVDGWRTAPTVTASPSPGALLLQDVDRPSVAVEMLHADGRHIPVLLSVSTLPSDLGGKVYVATDLSQQQRVQRLENLQLALSQIASEIRVPLGLAATFIADGLKDARHPEELMKKALRQIVKADLPLERVVRLAAAVDELPLPRVQVALRGLVDEIISQLPESDAESIRVEVRNPGQLMALASPHELVFCIQGVVAQLLRSKAQADVVEIAIGRSASRAFVLLKTGSAVPGTSARPSGPDAVDPAAQEMALLRPVLAGLMRRMGGSYHMRPGDRPPYRFVLDLGGI